MSYNIQHIYVNVIIIYIYKDMFSVYIIFVCVVFSRHEVPVTSQPIAIVHMDDDIVVVNKPASIPVSGLKDCHFFYILLTYLYTYTFLFLTH